MGVDSEYGGRVDNYCWVTVQGVGDSDEELSRRGCSKQNVTLCVCKNTESQSSTDVPTGMQRETAGWGRI
jgi:hypothetical protein